MRRNLLAAGLLWAALSAHAQTVPSDPDWREAQSPAPPALDLKGLIALDIPGSSLRFGVQPASVSIGADGIVRYVVVATSPSGAVNAIYEGIRCGSGDFRVLARHNPDSGWTIANDSPWRSLHEQPRSRHSLLIARTGACIGHGTNKSATRIVRDLRSSVDKRFETY